jgi:hypothetical protein
MTPQASDSPHLREPGSKETAMIKPLTVAEVFSRVLDRAETRSSEHDGPEVSVPRK